MHLISGRCHDCRKQALHLRGRLEGDKSIRVTEYMEVVHLPRSMFKIDVDNRDYHHLSQVEIAGDKRVYQWQSEGKTLGKGQALIVCEDSPGMDR